MPNIYMPIALSLNNRSCLVVGGGNVALRKINTLLDYDSSVTVVAPQVVKKIEYYAQKQRLKLERRAYKSPEAAHYGLVVAASDNESLNSQVFADCHHARVLVNVVDNPSLCDFIFPAVVKRDCLTLAVATDGKAPFLASHLRLILEDMFQEHWKQIAKLAACFRKKVRQRWPQDEGRSRECFQRFLHADWQTMLQKMSQEELEEELNRYLECS